MATILDAYNEFISLYNQYRSVGNNADAIRMARKIDEIAREQCARSDVSMQYKEHYVNTVAPVREWLAEMNIGLGHKKNKVSIEDEDKIKSTDWFSADVPKLTMRDVAGLQDLRDEFLVNVFAPISPKYAPIYKKYRKDIGLQILMYGPPGCGKTHIVKCLAGTLGCKIAVVQVKDVMANLVGDGAKIIAEIFEQAKKYDKCIIFFDEIDAIAASRDGDESRHTKEQLTTLLTNMDGFTSATKPGQIRIIIAATNRPWILDSAVKRGGRFDTQIYVPLPDFEARKKLIELALGKDDNVKNRVDVPCAENVTVEWLSEKLDGFAGADIKAVCKQIINRPLRREIEYLRDNGKVLNDCITLSDCEDVIGKYINSITDEMMLSYDAYAANMDVLDFTKLYEEKAKKAKNDGKPLPKYVLRWLEKLEKSENVKNGNSD
ncbi:MAG: ATP-binding protein [Clostridia bacterium]|nr:ATP-binding protein [Clostridia bacterium]